MKPKQKELNKKKYITFIIILILIISYAIYSVYLLIIKPTETFIVENGELSSEETFQGYIIRDESVLKGENYKNGLIQIKAEGEKVAKGEAIFRYYAKGESELIKKIEESMNVNEVKTIDLIIGGPPCQAYSLVGRGVMKQKVEDDKRNYLFRYYKDIVNLRHEVVGT